MNYWLTTHWPPREGDARPPFSGLYLASDRGEVGGDLQAGDLVLIYQARSGRTLVRRNPAGGVQRVPSTGGKGGIVAVCRATGGFHWDADAVPETYDDASTIHWAWFAPLEVLSTSGFVPRETLNRVLGYKDNYPLRGFGDRQSGLKRISESTFRELERAWVAARPPTVPVLPTKPRRGGPPGGEGEPHRRLKQFIAGAPAAALGEDGLVLTRMEHCFPTNDRADVALSDRVGRVIAVEVEVHVGDQDFEGLLQALKYRVMLEPLYDRERGDSRGILVAYSISAGMRALCARYDVECVAIPEAVVDAWHRERPGGADTLVQSLAPGVQSSQLSSLSTEPIARPTHPHHSHSSPDHR